MCKSKGNGIAPQQVRTRSAPRSCGCGSASTTTRGELTISNEILKRVVESYRRIRNTLRFLLANTSDFDPREHAVPVGEMVEIDRYALAHDARDAGAVIAATTRATSSTWWRRSCRRSAPRTSARSTSTS